MTESSRFENGKQDRLFAKAILGLISLELTGAAWAQPDLLKRLYGLIVLIELLAKISCSKASNSKVGLVATQILQGFYKAALPHEATLPTVKQLGDKGLKLLQRRYFPPNVKRIRDSITSQMGQRASARQIAKAVREAIKSATRASLAKAIRKNNEIIRIDLKHNWQILTTELTKRPDNWLESLLRDELQDFVAVVSIRTESDEIDQLLDEWRSAQTANIIDILLGVTMPGEELTESQRYAIVESLDDIRADQMLPQTRLKIKEIESDLVTALACLEPDI